MGFAGPDRYSKSFIGPRPTLLIVAHDPHNTLRDGKAPRPTIYTTTQ